MSQPSFSFGSTPGATPAPGASFNFGTTASTGTGDAAKAPAASFAFGTGAGAGSGSTPALAPAAGGFSFGGAATAATPAPAAAGGFSFNGGTPAPAAPAPAPAAGGFSFGAAPAAPAPAAESKTAAPSTGGFAFNAAAPAAAAPAPDPAAGGFSFGGGVSTPAPGTGTDDNAAAPAVGGFSFGGASTPAPAAAEDDKAAAPAAPAAGGFSFGGASTPAPAAAEDDKAAAPAAGGFSFGGASTPAPAAAEDDKAAAPAAPAAGGFAFGGASTPAPAAAKDDKSTTSTGTAVITTTAASTGPTPTKIGPPPKTYQNQTLEQIINSVSAQVESSTMEYITQARRVAHQDARLRDSQRNITHLSKDMTKLLVQQEELDRRLSQIGDVQDNLESCLGGLEGQVDTVFARTMTVGTIDDADVEREKYFNLVIETDERMNLLESVVEDLEKDLRNLQSECLEGGDLGKVVKVMNKQHDMLNTLETSCAKIESDMHLVGGKLTG
jgi:nuclear pore complex protein Nup62